MSVKGDAGSGDEGSKDQSAGKDRDALPADYPQTRFQDSKTAICREGCCGMAARAAQLPLRDQVAAGQEAEFQQQCCHQSGANRQNPYSGLALCATQPKGDANGPRKRQDETLIAETGQQIEKWNIWHAAVLSACLWLCDLSIGLGGHDRVRQVVLALSIRPQTGRHNTT